MTVGRQMHGDGALTHVDGLGIYRLLALVPDSADLRRFVTDTLGALATDDLPEYADLRQTLRILLETNVNVAETARRLFFHYNTLRYRIAKLERLVGPFTTDPELASRCARPQDPRDARHLRHRCRMPCGRASRRSLLGGGRVRQRPAADHRDDRDDAGQDREADPLAVQELLGDRLRSTDRRAGVAPITAAVTVPMTATPTELPSSCAVSLRAEPSEVWSEGSASMRATAEVVMTSRIPRPSTNSPAANPG